MVNRQLGRRLQIATVCIDQDIRNKLNSIAELGMQFDVTAELGLYPSESPSRALRVETNGMPEAILLELDRDRTAALNLAASLSRIYGDSIAVIAISSSPNPDAIIAAMRSGCWGPTIPAISASSPGRARSRR